VAPAVGSTIVASRPTTVARRHDCPIAHERPGLNLDRYPTGTLLAFDRYRHRLAPALRVPAPSVVVGPADAHDWNAVGGGHERSQSMRLSDPTHRRSADANCPDRRMACPHLPWFGTSEKVVLLLRSFVAQFPSWFHLLIQSYYLLFYYLLLRYIRPAAFVTANLVQSRTIPIRALEDDGQAARPQNDRARVEFRRAIDSSRIVPSTSVAADGDWAETAAF